VVEIGHEDQQHAQRHQEVADDRALLGRGGVVDEGARQIGLEGDDHAGGLQPGDEQPGDSAEEQADHHLRRDQHEQHQDRSGKLRQERVQGRRDHGGNQQRDDEAHAGRNIGLAEAG